MNHRHIICSAYLRNMNYTHITCSAYLRNMNYTHITCSAYLQGMNHRHIAYSFSIPTEHELYTRHLLVSCTWKLGCRAAHQHGTERAGQTVWPVLPPSAMHSSRGLKVEFPDVGACLLSAFSSCGLLWMPWPAQRRLASQWSQWIFRKECSESVSLCSSVAWLLDQWKVQGGVPLLLRVQEVSGSVLGLVMRSPFRRDCRAFHGVSLAFQATQLDADFCSVWVLHEELYLLGYNAVYSDESKPTFRRNMSPPSSGSRNKALKMEAICSSETSVDFRRTTRRYVPEDSTLHNHRCENIRSYGTLHDFPQLLQTREFLSLSRKEYWVCGNSLSLGLVQRRAI
jgi:hypothetical protein